MSADDTVRAVAEAANWDTRVAVVRSIPQHFGEAQHASLYASIARAVYVPNLAPDFAYIHWRPEYELDDIQSAYALSAEHTDGFNHVDPETLANTIRSAPATLRIFRLLLGFTVQEFAASTTLIAEQLQTRALTSGVVRNIESGRTPTEQQASVCAQVVDRAMRRELFAAPEVELRSKIDKPDTEQGWDTVRDFAHNGVPFPVFLHQRLYGGAFRQLLDATSTPRGNLLEDAVAKLFEDHEVPHIRTGGHNQEDIARRFGLSIRPAPDFVVYDTRGTLRAMLECKGANDGGTARDKAGRFGALRRESTRLGGVPVFAVLGGLGWTRVGDALGPVVRDTDGRVFMLPNLEQMLTVQPFPGLVAAT